VEYVVTVGASLLLELHATNLSAEAVSIENCLHTYFRIGDIHQAEVAGLKGAVYRDQLLAADIEEEGESIRFSAETDRIYQQTEAAVEIIDPSLNRIIHVRKSGSMSTVVWNPWIEKSKRMVDFGDDEYLQMVCVESGNVRECAVKLEPGERTSLGVEIESTPLK
jgi:glucose-6-phosphate 1-epimerase